MEEWDSTDSGYTRGSDCVPVMVEMVEHATQIDLRALLTRPCTSMAYSPDGGFLILAYVHNMHETKVEESWKEHVLYVFRVSATAIILSDANSA